MAAGGLLGPDKTRSKGLGGSSCDNASEKVGQIQVPTASRSLVNTDGSRWWWHRASCWWWRQWEGGGGGVELLSQDEGEGGAWDKWVRVPLFKLFDSMAMMGNFYKL